MNRLIPIIQYRDLLLISIQIEISDRIVHQLKNDIADTIRIKDVRGVIIEVSGVDLIDSYIACAIRDIGQICKLMGVHTLLVGLDPGMAITLVEMGMEMQGVDTALNIDHAVNILDSYEKDEQVNLNDEIDEDPFDDVLHKLVT